MSWQYRGLFWQEGFSAAGRLVFVNAKARSRCAPESR